MKKQKLGIIMALVLCFGLLFTACGNSDSDGKDTGENTEQTKITIVGSTSVGPHIDALTKLYNEKADSNVTFTVEQVGSGQGIKAVSDGSADIGMSSREIKEEEGPMEEFQICTDGISIIVNQANPVKEITQEQLKEIYLGNITNWSELGGDDATINLYTRESTSGTRGAFEELVLGKDANDEQIVIDETICSAVLNSNGQLGQSVQSDPNAIGYLSMGLVSNYQVNALKLDGVEPTEENVAAGTYALSRPFLLLTKATPEGKVKEFLDWVMNDEEARKYLEDSGFVI